MKPQVRKLAIAVVAGCGSIAAVALLRGKAGGRRAASLRVERGLTALRLVARGGARYASNAPKLFAAAGEMGTFWVKVLVTVRPVCVEPTSITGALPTTTTS